MKMRNIVIITAVMFLAVFSGDALGEVKPGSFELTPSIGGYVFENNQDLTERMLFGAGLGYNFSERCGMEFLVNYMDTEFDRTQNEVDVFLYRLNYLYHFPVSEKFIPFVSAGLGAITFDPDTGGDEEDFLVDYGVGLKYFFNDFLALRGDVQHVVTFDENNNNMAYTLGLSYVFGGRKAVAAPTPQDSDGDGVNDAADSCPDTPAGVAVDHRGCPLDTDGDGVYDYLDKCPDTPSGVAVDTRGCPLDTDGDGVYDYLDKCPDTPEGVKVDKNGCSGAGDADGDGVPDDRDKCPGTPAGAPVDSQGCPLDTDGDGVYDYLDKCPGTPKAATVDERGCWVIEAVHFDFGKADLKEVSYAVLDKVVTVLAANPNLTVEIGGHTDNVGPAVFNKRLSQQRAQAVMAYFVKQGIAADRLSAKGYGFDVPAATNDTEAGRAKNRRVELKPM